MVLITMCLGVTAGSFYEICECLVDHWLGLHLSVVETATDTDLGERVLGAAIGGIFLGLWVVTRYTSRREPWRGTQATLSGRGARRWAVPMWRPGGRFSARCASA